MASTVDCRPVKKVMQELADQKRKTTKNILFQVVNKNQLHLTFNRPKAANAFSYDMYFSFIEFHQKANEMEQIKYIVFRGSGGNYSSGNDFKNFMIPQLDEVDRKVLAATLAEVAGELTVAVLKSRKPIFAIVEGRAIGFGFTQLALYDRVFAVDNSEFTAPLVKLAQGPQMASSYTFPKFFGQTLAQEIIIKCKKMTAKELQKYGFLTSCKTVGNALQQLNKHIEQLQQLDWASYLQARKLMRLGDKENILKANKLQQQNLSQRWSNPDLAAFLMRYLEKQKSKPKL